jgi:hypothetical protein
MAMLTTKRSVPLLSGVSVIAIGLATSPIAIDIHPMGVGDNAAFAQGGHGGGGGGGGGHGGGGGGGGMGGGGGGPGGGGGMGGQGPRSGAQGAGPGMGMQQGPMSQGGMTQRMQHQAMNRETIRSVQRRLNQLGYRAGPEDGIMGPRTHRAISAYQRRMGMEANGMLTPDLVDRMMAGSKGK